MNIRPLNPAFAGIAAAAAAVGIAARHIPARPDAIGTSDIAAFGRAFRELPGPVLGYCRSGLRAATLWETSRSRGYGPRRMRQRQRG